LTHFGSPLGSPRDVVLLDLAITAATEAFVS
jgi:hypothetical protein